MKRLQHVDDNTSGVAGVTLPKTDGGKSELTPAEVNARDRKKAVSFLTSRPMDILQTLAYGSCIGAAVEKYVAHPHRNFPVALFKVLDSPERAAIVSSMLPCRRDAFTLQLEERYPGLEGDMVQKVLRLEATMTMADISRLESLHGTIRRHAVGKSVQTWCIGFPKLSTEFALQCVRNAGHKGTTKKVLLAKNTHPTKVLLLEVVGFCFPGACNIPCLVVQRLQNQALHKNHSPCFLLEISSDLP
eukprot:3346210-Amphidinium_carterae.2